jgi:hypothetical protein
MSGNKIVSGSYDTTCRVSLDPMYMHLFHIDTGVALGCGHWTMLTRSQRSLS